MKRHYGRRSDEDHPSAPSALRELELLLEAPVGAILDLEPPSLTGAVRARARLRDDALEALRVDAGEEGGTVVDYATAPRLA